MEYFHVHICLRTVSKGGRLPFPILCNDAISSHTETVDKQSSDPQYYFDYCG